MTASTRAQRGRRRADWPVASSPASISCKPRWVPYAAAWELDNARALRASGPLWVVLGDSMSQGIGADAYDHGWVHRAAAALADRGRHYRIVNLSRSGATTADVLGHQLPSLEGLVDPPALTTLLIGSNDMLRRDERAHLERRFEEILCRLPEHTVLAYLPQPVPLARRINARIDAATAKRRLHPFSVRPAARYVFGHRSADLFHPNNRGYARLAELFTAAALAVPY